jgi:hypothetical protein
MFLSGIFMVNRNKQIEKHGHLINEPLCYNVVQTTINTITFSKRKIINFKKLI